MSSSDKRTNYSCDAIRVLEGLEPVRLRPGMYLGSLDEHAAGPVLASLIDFGAMHFGGSADRVIVTVNDDRIVTVEEFSDTTPQALELFATTLHGRGGRAWEDPSFELMMPSLAIANAVSWKFVAEVMRDGERHRLVCRQGKVDHSFEIVGDAWRSGTKIEAVLDNEMLGPDVRFTPAIVDRECERFALLVPGLRIHRMDERDGTSRELYYPNGPVDRLFAMGVVDSPRQHESTSTQYRVRVATARVERPETVFVSNVVDSNLGDIGQDIAAHLPRGVGAVVEVSTSGGRIEPSVALQLVEPHLRS